jgi:hypothetical protein
LRRAEGGAKNVGVFRVKNHDFTQKKSHFFPFLGGARAGCAPPPGSALGNCVLGVSIIVSFYDFDILFCNSTDSVIFFWFFTLLNALFLMLMP